MLQEGTRAEMDSELWESNLRILGADFRAASDVFSFVTIVKQKLQIWSLNGESKLDILIKNAAQTLTDPLDQDVKATQQERKLVVQKIAERSKFQLTSSIYEARVRGDVQPSHL
ncbi:hypothetical protein WAI453_013510 [Rhynchosporium graminicola]